MAATRIIAETDRLILRGFASEDFEDLYEYLSDEDTLRFEPYRAMDKKQAEAELERRIASDEMIAVCLKPERKVIGNLYLGKRKFASFELGYVFNRRYRGRGYATESCAALIKKAFSEGAHRIYAECDPLNAPSWRLLERLGFERQAHFKQNIYFWTDENGAPIWKDTFVYALLNPNAARKA